MQYPKKLLKIFYKTYFEKPIAVLSPINIIIIMYKSMIKQFYIKHSVGSKLRAKMLINWLKKIHDFNIDVVFNFILIYSKKLIIYIFCLLLYYFPFLFFQDFNYLIFLL